MDKKKYSGTELQTNYQYLIDKWGEWELIGEGMSGLVIRYVNVGNALFSGLMITYMVLSIVAFVLAITFGKIVFPMLSKHYANTNDEMVDLAALKSASQIDEIVQEKKKNKKEWF